MKQTNQKSTTFYCFSPPVMIATFVIEIVLAVFTLVRYRLSAVTKLAATVLFCLAIFQLAEYNVCEGVLGLSADSWARLGFVAITLLPPLGLHLATKLAHNKQPVLVAGGYTAAAAFAVFFAGVEHGVTGPVCQGNYVIFHIAAGAGGLYMMYYYALLFIAVGYSLVKAAAEKQAHRARALRALSLGYAAFIIPTTAVNYISPETKTAIPSIMCGFAVLLAVIIAAEVLPQYHSKQNALKSRSVIN